MKKLFSLVVIFGGSVLAGHLLEALSKTNLSKPYFVIGTCLSASGGW